MKQYELWAEGYISIGDRAQAKKLATVSANSFVEACEKHMKSMGPGYKHFWRITGETAHFYGCQVFDNEKDARKRYG